MRNFPTFTRGDLIKVDQKFMAGSVCKSCGTRIKKHNNTTMTVLDLSAGPVILNIFVSTWWLLLNSPGRLEIEIIDLSAQLAQ